MWDFYTIDNHSTSSWGQGH